MSQSSVVGEIPISLFQSTSGLNTFKKNLHLDIFKNETGSNIPHIYKEEKYSEKGCEKVNPTYISANYSQNNPFNPFSENPKKIEDKKEILIGPPRLTRFERARIVGARALQIAMGAPILIEPKEGMTNPIDIALEELKRGVLPITIRRTLPDGVTYQDIPLRWLL